MKDLLLALDVALSGGGFVNAGSRLLRRRGDVVQVIEPQKSKDSTSSQTILTVNLGVFSTTLAERLGKPLTTPDVWDAHWRRRLGFLGPDKADRWWQIANNKDFEAVAREVLRLVVKYAVPVFDEYSSTSKLQALWESGQCPGMTEAQRIRYLETLRSLAH